ncbi:hypothetical protein OQ968_20875 [Mycobacterium sp. 663a-19]|nr:hypothetical protein [Mycobacterium sp. 663a-19]MEB3983709.1 hypothetical protein [Mycobacterium sp. 663a-19]
MKAKGKKTLKVAALTVGVVAAVLLPTGCTTTLAPPVTTVLGG